MFRPSNNRVGKPVMRIRPHFPSILHNCPHTQVRISCLLKRHLNFNKINYCQMLILENSLWMSEPFSVVLIFVNGSMKRKDFGSLFPLQLEVRNMKNLALISISHKFKTHNETDFTLITVVTIYLQIIRPFSLVIDTRKLDFK